MAAQSALPNDIRESIAVNSVSSVSGQPAMMANLAFANLINNINLSQQNAVTNQQAMNQLTLTIAGKAVNMISNIGPLEAAAVSQLNASSDLASAIAALQAALKGA